MRRPLRARRGTHRRLRRLCERAGLELRHWRRMSATRNAADAIVPGLIVYEPRQMPAQERQQQLGKGQKGADGGTGKFSSEREEVFQTV